MPTDQQCTNGFLTRFPNVPRNDRETRYFASSYSMLIPGMNFTCKGKIQRVTVGGMMRHGNNRNQRMKLRIWKENATEPGIYHKSEKVLASNICNYNRQSRQYICQSTDGMQDLVSVEPGDILGIELPSRDTADFELHSVSAPGLTNYIFKGTSLPSTIDLRDRIDETKVQPLIIITGMFRNNRQNQGMYYY